MKLYDEEKTAIRKLVGNANYKHAKKTYIHWLKGLPVILDNGYCPNKLSWLTEARTCKNRNDRLKLYLNALGGNFVYRVK